MKITIYCITNLLNGKRYIGQTKRFDVRMYQHFIAAPKSKCSYAITRAIRKYGKESFRVDVLEEVDSNFSDAREVHWISHYNSMCPDFGYNLESGGNHQKSLSESTRKKIGESRRKFFENLTEEEREEFKKKRAPIWSEESRAKIGNANSRRCKGVSKSEEHKERMRQAQLNRICKTDCRCLKCIPQLKLGVEQIQEMQKLHAEGMKKSEIVAMYKLSPTTVGKYLKLNFQNPSASNENDTSSGHDHWVLRLSNHP